MNPTSRPHATPRSPLRPPRPARRPAPPTSQTASRAPPSAALDGATQSTASDDAPGAAPGRARAGYDFRSGARTLFADDFSRDPVGDFPRQLEFRNGSLEIVDLDGRRALRAKTEGAFDVVLPETLPERFTIEFDYYGVEFVNSMVVVLKAEDGQNAGPNYIQVDAYKGVGIAAQRNSGASSSVQPDRRLDAQMLPIRVMADGQYVKVFVGQERVANVPNADLGRSSRVRFAFDDVRGNPVYIANLRIATE